MVNWANRGDVYDELSGCNALVVAQISRTIAVCTTADHPGSAPDGHSSRHRTSRSSFQEQVLPPSPGARRCAHHRRHPFPATPFAGTECVWLLVASRGIGENEDRLTCNGTAQNDSRERPPRLGGFAVSGPSLSVACSSQRSGFYELALCAWWGEEAGSGTRVASKLVIFQGAGAIRW